MRPGPRAIRVPSLLRRAMRLLFLPVLVLCSAIAGAQSTGGAGSPRFATRAMLEASAAAADTALQSATTEPLREAKRAEAWTLRERLRVGDFHPGDRIAVV